VEGQRINAFMVEKIIGSKVINLKGETLGKIENLVIDIDTGRIVYAVLESGGFWASGISSFPSLGNPLQLFHQKAYSSSINRKNKWQKHLLLTRTSCQTWRI
jgi:sporulation protein YlmC with PRC-barrel domain